MVTLTETTSEHKLRRRCLRDGPRGPRAEISDLGSLITDQKNGLPAHLAIDQCSLVIERGAMLAGGKKQYYLDQEIALYLLGCGNNGRYYDATTGRFLSEDPTGEASGDNNLFRYTGNDPINNLDPSGHDSQKPYHPPQNQQAQQHNPPPQPLNTSHKSLSTFFKTLLAGKTITPRQAPRPGAPGGWRTLRPTDRPKPPSDEPGPTPSEPTDTPTTPGGTPGTDVGSGAATGEGGGAAVTAGETGAEVGVAVETGGEVAAGTTVAEVGGGIAVGPVAVLGAIAGAVGAGVGWVVQKVAIGPIQKAIHAHQESAANAKGVAAVKHIKETHPANLPKDKPAPATQPGTWPAKPATTVPGEKGGAPVTKTEGTETKEPSPPTKEEQPVKKQEEPKQQREEKVPVTQPSKHGGENPAAVKGREAHKEFAGKVKSKPGWQSEPRLTDPKTGKTVKPDAVTPSGKPVELKPNTPSGRTQGKRQLPKYSRATGKKGKVIYYEPNN